MYKKYLELESAISKVSYPKYILGNIKQYLIDNYSDNDMTQIYIVDSDNENIFVIKYNLIIELNRKNYRVPVLVYLPILFPIYPPEFYIEAKSNYNYLNVNSFYKDIINSNDLRINLDYFMEYDSNKINISEIIDNLMINFTQNFPIYKAKYNKSKYSGKCILDYSKAIIVKLPKKK